MFFLLKLCFTAGDGAQELTCLCVQDIFLYRYMNTHRKRPCHHTFRVCDRCFDLFLPQCSSLLWLVLAGGVLPSCFSAETAFLCIPLIQEPKVIDGFNKARCNTPNEWADVGFIINTCILRAVNRSDDGRRFHDIPIIRVWTRHIGSSHAGSRMWFCAIINNPFNEAPHKFFRIHAPIREEDDLLMLMRKIRPKLIGLNVFAICLFFEWCKS